jgi:RimJ/RimL family protein N-acetyltransferase
MKDKIKLAGARVVLRRWRDEDRAPFAAMNGDPRVMTFFKSPLTRAQSDAMIDFVDGQIDEKGVGLWAVEVPGVAPFIGFTGLAVLRFAAHFTPCVEIGWRLAFDYWGKGYATASAQLALRYGFDVVNLDEIVSFTSTANRRSRAVMERLRMRHDPAEDFGHPEMPDDHPLRPHVLYRLASTRSHR